MCSIVCNMTADFDFEMLENESRFFNNCHSNYMTYRQSRGIIKHYIVYFRR